MIHWFKDNHANIVAHPEDAADLKEIQRKLQQFFTNAQPIDHYRFPAVLYYKDIMYDSISIGRLKQLLSSSTKDMVYSFRARDLIIHDNHILLCLKPATSEAAASLDALTYLISHLYPGEALNTLVMPLAWIPSGQLFPDSFFEEVLRILSKEQMEITINLRALETLSSEQWQYDWGNVFGSLEEM